MSTSVPDAELILRGLLVLVFGSLYATLALMNFGSVMIYFKRGRAGSMFPVVGSLFGVLALLTWPGPVSPLAYAAVPVLDLGSLFWVIGWLWSSARDRSKQQQQK